MMDVATNGVEIRELRPDEHDAWLRLRERLWPDTAREELTRELEEILSDPGRNAVLVAASAAGELVGFVEVGLRDWAEGCDTRPVGYVEGWYVEPGRRRSGVGRRLMDAAERWALSGAARRWARTRSWGTRSAPARTGRWGTPR